MPIAYTATERIIDSKGRPVVNGYVYFGVFGADPEVSSIAIYSDEDLTTPLANPQRTDDLGRFSNDVYLGSDYSYTIKNKNSVIVEGPKDRRLLLNSNDTAGIRAVFNDVADLKAGTLPDSTTASIAALATEKAKVSTKQYAVANPDKGGSPYIIKALTQHRTDIGDGSWVPSGHDSHYLLGGTTYVAILIPGNSVDVYSLGIVDDGSTDNSSAIDTLITNYGPIVFPEGTFLFDSVEIDTQAKVTIKGAGRSKTILKAHSAAEFLLRFRNVTLIEFEDLTIDCDSIVGIGISIIDALAGERDFVMNRCDVLNCVGGASNGNEGTGISVTSEFNTFIVRDCNFKKMRGATIASGIRFSGSDTFGSDSVIVSGCRFEDVQNTTSNVDADGVAIVCNLIEPTHLNVVVDSCKFLSCETRCVKTQARYTKVTNCHITNRSNTSRVGQEIDVQRGSSTVANNSFEYTDATTTGGAVISVRAYQTNAFSDPVDHVIANNKVKMDSGILPVFLGLAAEEGGTVQSALVTGNICGCTVNYFASLTTTQTASANRMNATFTHNSVQDINDGFLYLVKDLSDPDDSGAGGFFKLNFIGNISFGSNKRQIQAHPTAANGDNLTVISNVNANNIGIDPTIVDNHSNTHLNQIEQFLQSGNRTLGKYGDNDTEKGIRYIFGADTVTYSSTTSSTGSRSHHLFYDTTNGLSGSINTSGGSTTYSTTSDERLKRNPNPVDPELAMEIINNLAPKFFQRLHSEKIECGFYAQEIFEHIPGAVIKGDDTIDDQGKLANPWMIDKEYIIPYLVAAIQYLAKEKS